MYYSKLENKRFLIRLERGEEIALSIKEFCKKHKISNALFIGLGSIENPTLAHYKVDNKKYSEKTLSGIFELTSLVGNAAVFEGEPLIHCHVNISDEEMRVFGGHLVKAKVSATSEIVLQNLGSTKVKKYNDEIGLKLFELDQNM